MSQIILGIDPGSKNTGIGIINKQSQRLFLLHHQVIDCTKLKFLGLKLKKIFSTLKDVIDTYKPEAAVLEKVFYGLNAHSTIVLAHVRGAAFTCAELADVPVFEYASREIKLAVTGNGGADKKQVQSMVRIILNQKKLAAGLDESDALAAAICHAHQPKLAKFIRP